MSETRDSLKTFASAVLARASLVPEGEFRLGRKVFVAALEPSKVTKSLLLEAHRAGLLTLTRCDLTQAFSGTVIAESEISYLNATFHFILLP